MITRKEYSTRPPTYRNLKYVTGRYIGKIAQYEYIGRSIEKS